MTSIPDRLVPTEDESAIARRIVARLQQLQQRGDADQVGPSKGSGPALQFPRDGESIELPPVTLKLLTQLATELAAGHEVALVPVPRELTTQQAADLLHVSRPFIVKQLDSGAIPYRKVGSHRRILLSDLREYQRETTRKRHETLDELSAQAQELDMGY